MRNFYSGNRTEISLRDELINTLDGNFPEISKKQKGVVRRMRRDSSDNLIACVCNDLVSGEGDKDGPCPYCLGEKFYWEEEFIYFYRFEPGYDTSRALKEMNIVPGNLNVPLRVFYVDYQGALTKDDKMIELVLDSSGDPVEPLRRRAIYRIGSLFDARADEGRIEYWKVVCYEDKTLSLNVV